MKVHLFPARFLAKTDGGEFNIYNICGLDNDSLDLLKNTLNGGETFRFLFDYQMLRGEEMEKSLEALWDKVSLKRPLVVCILFDFEFEEEVIEKIRELNGDRKGLKIEVEDRGVYSINSGFPTIENGEHDSRLGCLQLDSFQETDTMPPRLLKEVCKISAGTSDQTGLQ
jgi:hypothetical protein